MKYKINRKFPSLATYNAHLRICSYAKLIFDIFVNAMVNNNNNNNMCASCQSSRLFVVRILRGSLIAHIKCELAATCSAIRTTGPDFLSVYSSVRLLQLSVI